MIKECVEDGLDNRERAMRAYARDDYQAALQLMCRFLESSIRTLMFCSGAQRSPEDATQAQQVYEAMSLSQGAKSLYVLGVISKAQCDRALQLTRTCDQLIAPEGEGEAAPEPEPLEKSEFEKIFACSNELADEFLLLASKAEV